MAGVFRYWLSGSRVADVTPGLIRARGLADRLGDCVTGSISTQAAELTDWPSGPDGACGVIICPMPLSGDIVAAPGFAPDRQKWIDLGEGVWLGWDLEHKPNATGLSRPKTIAGYAFDLLNDGDVWICPTIRRAVWTPAVPCYFSNLDGELRPVPRAEYREIWEKSAEWIITELKGGMTIEQAVDCAVRCLGLNYRVGLSELSALELLTNGDDGTTQRVIDSALDIPWFKAAREAPEGDPKKKLWRGTLSALWSDSPSSSDGAADSSATTSQAAPT